MYMYKIQEIFLSGRQINNLCDILGQNNKR